MLLPNPYRVAVAEHDLRETDVSFLQYQVIPIVLLIVISVGLLGTALLTARDFERGTAKIVVLSPAGRLPLVLGRLLGGSLITVALVTPLVALGFVTHYIPYCHEESEAPLWVKLVLSGPCGWQLPIPSWTHALALIALFTAVTLTTVGLGTLLGVALRDARLVTMTGLNGAAYLFFLGGGFTTVAFLPDWIQAASRLVPTSYAINGLRQALVLSGPRGLRTRRARAVRVRRAFGRAGIVDAGARMEKGMTRSRVLVILACLAAIACDEDPARSTKIIPRPATRAAETAPGAVGSSPSAAPGAAARGGGALPAAGPAATPSTASGSSRSTEQGTSAKADGSKGAPANGKRPGAAVPSGTEPVPEAKQMARGATSADAAVSAASRPSSTEGRIEGCPPPPEDGPGPSTLSVTGPCAFQHQGTFACEASADDFYVSASRKAARGATLLVYINVERYKGPGTYKDAQMYIGVQDKTSIQRWSSDKVDITIGPGEEFAVLPSTRLDAEPVLVGCSGPMTNFQCGGRDTTFEAPPATASGTLRCEGGGGKKQVRSGSLPIGRATT